ncbi:MAG TPA: tRNA preQ1(34) S-adenosylmethionine ribosyltransferase-isomerase QueA [Pyrinomonadaceae bacterium]|nr:tRNA preQ1(34) S-adenosylmethionine ribosyltransferase-isomerase QueA [Pyrinomonadaceae bacterium]
MHISEFDFDLPTELIASEPLERRDRSRMLRVDRASSEYKDSIFSGLPELLEPSDVLVVNNTKVFPARLLGKSETGAAVEIFLVRELEDASWMALAKPARRLPRGKTINFGPGFSGQVLERSDDGQVRISFQSDLPVQQSIELYGRTPLPPYIKRDRESADTDRERYQTIYASQGGAIAAPTAGLHFTPEVFEQLRAHGIEIVEVTLHVGYGTFEPVKVEDLSEHRVQPERYSLDQEAAESLNLAKIDGRRIIAVGTTTTRTLETVIGKLGKFEASSGLADLTILPGYRFNAIDGLLTNFHLPKSSLLALVSTFGGHDLIMSAYRHAVASGYRFYSYGDCMLIT